MFYSDKKYLTHRSMFPFALHLVSLMSKRNNSDMSFLCIFICILHIIKHKLHIIS